MKSKSGFTIVELLVVIVVIGILTAIGVFSFLSVQKDQRDASRNEKITSIAEALEKYYDKNGVYPSCTALTSNEAAIKTLLPGIQFSSFQAPKDSATNSVQCSEIVGSVDKFAYIGDGSSTCVTGSFCINWILKYKEEATGNIKEIKSRHT